MLSFSWCTKSRQSRLRRYSNAVWAVFVVIAVSNTVVAWQEIHAKAKRGARESCLVGSRSINSRVGTRCSSTPSLSRRRPSLLYTLHQYENNAEAGTEQEYFVASAQFVHLGPAARILTEEFYSHKTNFITFQLERLKTVLSLESTFPNQQNSISKEYSRRPLQQMIVACDAKTGQVVGFAEVDARSLGNDQSIVGIDSASGDGRPNKTLRSYMYNLAVDKKWKRKGIASALVKACEEFVSDMHDSCVEKRLYLRVRKCNRAAVALYEKRGYREMNPEFISLNKEDVNRGSLEDGELILFAKDLSVDTECMLD